MSENGIRFDRSDLQRVMKNKGIEIEAEEKKKEPQSTGMRVRNILLTAAACVYFFFLFFGRYFLPGDNEILRSLDVFSGAENPNRLIRIVSLAILTLSISAVLRFFIGRMANNSALTKRTGRAMIELFANFVKYTAFIVLIFLILSALGVNTTELLAGLGILSLVLGLGVTSLIEDVVAGIFIIAERLYDVGDVVVVDDFRGTIVSIGIRSTQIEDDGGDILILRNSNIESLINMTNRSSYAICDIPVAASEPFEHVEEVINNAHLEQLSKQYPEIEKGPFYLGLSEISESGLQIITFVAVCDENSKYRIQRMVNRELKLLFERNNIKLGEDSDDEG